MPEFERIATYLAPLAGQQGLGLTDDAALFEPPLGKTLVLAKDMLVAGVHVPASAAPEVFAQRAMRTNLSDMAAMGAKPLGYLLGLGLPGSVPDTWLEAFAIALMRDQQAFGCTLWGGDSIKAPTDITISMTLIGAVTPGKALKRGGAQPGDDIYVSGHIGAAAAGLKMALGTLPDGLPEWLLAYEKPMPRLALGRGLVGLATACIDVSDGLIADIEHVAQASGVCADIRLADVPIAEGLPIDALTAVTAGDDYELAFTAPPDRRDAIFTLSERIGVSVSRIGKARERVASAPNVKLLDATKTPIKVKDGGWQH